MLSRKVFATNSLKQNFVWDGWFGCDAHYNNTQSTPYDSNSGIDRFVVFLYYKECIITMCWHDIAKFQI